MCYFLTYKFPGIHNMFRTFNECLNNWSIFFFWSTGPYKPFPITTISHILKEEITHRLRDVQYDPVSSREMTLTLCEVGENAADFFLIPSEHLPKSERFFLTLLKVIRTRMKEFMISRYKTVILVHIGQLNGQGMQISSRCLWDPNFDTFVSHSFKNTSLFCSATVYGIYFE